jgi:hypothetical protein
MTSYWMMIRQFGHHSHQAKGLRTDLWIISFERQRMICSSAVVDSDLKKNDGFKNQIIYIFVLQLK